MEKQTPELMDMMMASGVMLEVFMLQVSLEIGRSKADPAAWAQHFVDALHARVDANEERTGDRRYPVHELARQGFDRLGGALMQLLSLPPNTKL